jgi:predicted transcriptional regulator
MNTAERLEMLDWLIHLKDTAIIEKLRELKAGTKPYPQDETVGYTVLGEPLTREQYYTKLERGEKDIDEGRYMTDRELQNDMKNW